MFPQSQVILFFIIVFSLIQALLGLFIIFIIYNYKQKQNIYYKQLENLQSIHNNAILQAQLEMQEQTFVNISREIHDNVGQKLALTKLQLIHLQNNHPIVINDTINTITTAIQDLSDLSRTMSADAILANGFINAMEFEMQQLNKTVSFNTTMTVEGEAVFLDGKRELVLFRIVQEAMQNIIKHAGAKNVIISIVFTELNLTVNIIDDGKGFVAKTHNGQGLKNIEARAVMLAGSCEINSELEKGTNIKITIPINDAKSSN